MKFKSVFFLLIILIGLVLYLVFFEKNMKSTDEKKTLYNRVFVFEPDSINKIFLRSKEDKFSINKADGSWFLEHPINVRADNDELESILNDLSFLEFKRQVEADKSEIGLLEPEYELSFSSENEKYSIASGKTASLGANIYISARTKGEREKFYLVDSAIKDTLDKNIYDLRSKDLVPDTISSPDKIIIKRDNLIITLTKDKKFNEWNIVTPVTRLADQKRINEIILSFRNLRILEFIEDNVAGDFSDYGLSNPFLSVSFFDRDIARTVNFGNFFNNESRCYAVNDEEANVYAVESNATRIFLSSLFELSTKKIFKLDQTEFKSFEISYLKNNFSVTNINSDRIVSKPLGILVDDEKVQWFFKLLNSFEIKEYVIDTSAKEKIKNKFSPYLLKLDYTDTDKSPLNYAFYFDAQDFYISDVTTDRYWRVKEVPTADIPFDVLFFAKKNVISISRYTLDVMEFNTPDAAGALTERNGIWHLNDTILIPEETEKILSALERIKVQTIYSLENEHILDDLQLKYPVMYFEFKFKDNTPQNNKNFKLLIGKDSSGLTYAQREGNPLIFTLKTEQIRALNDQISKYIKSAKD